MGDEKRMIDWVVVVVRNLVDGLNAGGIRL